MFPSRYYPGRYYPGRYYPHPVPVVPGVGAGYYPTRYYPGRYFPQRYYPGTVPPVPPGPGAGYYAGRYHAGRYYPNRYYPGTAPAITLPPSLIAAVLAQLRSFNGGAVATAFGDAQATPKFWRGDVLGSPGLPWLRIDRPVAAPREFQSFGNFIARGQLQINIFADGSESGRVLAKLLNSDDPDKPGALDDPPLMWKNARLMKFRIDGDPVEMGTPGPSVGAPAAYHRVILFNYWYSGRIF